MRMEDLAEEQCRDLKHASRRIPFRYQRLMIVEGPLHEAQGHCVRSFVRRTERDDLRRRFGTALAFDHEATLRRAFATKPDGEMIWSLDEQAAIAGICHCVPVARDESEVALIVRSDLKDLGIGEYLLRQALARAAHRGLKALSASVLRDNWPMLRLAMKVGCVLRQAHGETIEIAFNVSQHAALTSR